MDCYYNPVRTYLGAGSLAVLPQLVKDLNPGKILLLIWDESVLQNRFIKAAAAEWKDKLTVKTFAWSNPELLQLYEMYNETKNAGFALVIAVGGGSVLDVGKSLCCLYAQDIASPEELRSLIETKSYKAPACKWIGVPTTAGTGSEVTCWATVWDSEHDKKYSVDTQANYAYAAVVDPELANTMPVKLAVSSALDAVCHAAESYWAKASNATSRAAALAAIKIIMQNLNGLLCSKEEAHEAMAQGSLLAGMAFSNTRTTACHSISYPLTMKYHIPHGVAVSMLLAPVMQLNMPYIKNSRELLAAFGADSAAEVAQKVTDILEKSGSPAKLSQWGAAESDFDEIIAHSMTKGRADNNPAELNAVNVKEILKNIL